MAVRSDFVATFYQADVDSATSAYSEVLISTLAGYSGYGTTTAYIVAPENGEEYEVSTLTDVGGWRTASFSIRDTFTMELYPFTFNDGSAPDLTDWKTLRAWLIAKEHLWVSIVAGSRNYPTDATKAHPVIITDIARSVNRAGALHSVTLTLQVQGAL